MSEGTTNGKTTSAVPSATAPSNPTKPLVEQTLAQQEHDFFNQVPNEKEKAKLTKDSILALYGAAPAMNSLPTNNQFMQSMPSMNDNGALFGMQYQQQPSFGMPPPNPSAGVLNNFAQFGLMQPGQSMNFQQSHTLNSMPNQSMGFSTVPQANPSLHAFNQPNASKTNNFAAPNVNNVNQQFGSLNLGNVWQ